MQIQRIKEIIRNYLSGGARETERTAVDSWVDSVTKRPLPHSTEELENIRQDMAQHIHVRSRSVNRLWRISGSVASVLLMGIVLFKVITYSPHSYATGHDEHRRVILDDGSVIRLGENSRLTIDRHFDSDRLRQVTLIEGEAFFEIQKDPDRPFIIKNSVMQTEVLGTSFMIRSLSSAKTWTIKVHSGKVKVARAMQPAQSYIMYAGDSLAYHKDTDMLDQIKATPEHLSPLVFKDEDLQQIVSRLSIHYHRALRIESGLEHLHQFSGEFKGDATLEEILDVICLATGTRYESDHDTVFISYKTE